MLPLSNELFRKYQELIYKNTGILLRHNKNQLLQLKLNKIIKRNNIETYEKYFLLLTNDNKGIYFQEFINVITTNTTSFFREATHFDYLINNIDYIVKNNPRITEKNEIRVWSAGCSTGQEAATLAILLREYFKNKLNIKILATDIDTKVISKAISGFYSDSDCAKIPKAHLDKCFTKIDTEYKLKDEYLRLIKYRQFNLMNTFNFKKGFDLIFCRNVMIYFNNSVQEILINKFYNDLVTGGILFVGHSESLFNKVHEFKNIGPSIYIK